jgi:hypothetical protein
MNFTQRQKEILAHLIREVLRNRDKKSYNIRMDILKSELTELRDMFRENMAIEMEQSEKGA